MKTEVREARNATEVRQVDRQRSMTRWNLVKTTGRREERSRRRAAGPCGTQLSWCTLMAGFYIRPFRSSNVVQILLLVLAIWAFRSRQRGQVLAKRLDVAVFGSAPAPSQTRCFHLHHHHNLPQNPHCLI